MTKAKIEIRSKSMDSLPNYVQHLFIIYTDSEGKEWIIRGGPDSSFVTGDMKFDVMLPYGEFVNNGKKSIDWTADEVPSISLTAGMSEDEIVAAVSKMVSRAEYLHSLKLDYKTATLHAVPVLDEFANYMSKSGLPFFGDFLHLQNSNTFVRDVVEHAGLKFELPMCGDEVCNAPGWQHEFRDTKYDKLFRWDVEELTYAEMEELIFACAFSIASIDFGVERIRRSEVYRKLRDAARDAIKKLTGRGDDDDDKGGDGSGGGSGTGGFGAAGMEKAFEEAIVREESRERDAERTREEREMYEEQLRISILKMEEKRLKDLMEQKLAEYIKSQEKEIKITQEAKVA